MCEPWLMFDAMLSSPPIFISDCAIWQELMLPALRESIFACISAMIFSHCGHMLVRASLKA